VVRQTSAATYETHFVSEDHSKVPLVHPDEEVQADELKVAHAPALDAAGLKHSFIIPALVSFVRR
jgi:hypothetical protein